MKRVEPKLVIDDFQRRIIKSRSSSAEFQVRPFISRLVEESQLQNQICLRSKDSDYFCYKDMMEIKSITRTMKRTKTEVDFELLQFIGEGTTSRELK